MIIVEVGHIGEVDQLQSGAAVRRESPKFPIAVQDQPAAVEGPVGASMIISSVRNTSAALQSWSRS